MMDADAIKDLAKAFEYQRRAIEKFPSADNFEAQRRDDVVSVADVIVRHAPDYDIDEFYEAAGYFGAHPRHPVLWPEE